MNRVLVTGGCGFIGSAIVPALQKAGAEVCILDNNSYGSRDTIAVEDSAFFGIDILDREGVFACLSKVRPDVVVHLAAVHFIPHCNQFPFESSNVNLRGTINVLDAAAAVGSVRSLLFASTAAVYPCCDGPIPETQAVQPLDIYGLAKSVGETLCHGFHATTGISTIICRFFNAFGPNETNPHLIPEIQKQLREGGRTLRLGNLEPKRDFIHTTDMAAAILRLLESFAGKFDVFNLGSGQEYSVQEIVDTFSLVLGEPIRIEVDSSRVRKIERPHLLADIGKLKRETGWSPKVNLLMGLKSMIEGAVQ
jgi:UDP-glucose 4-epimerase